MRLLCALATILVSDGAQIRGTLEDRLAKFQAIRDELDQAVYSQEPSVLQSDPYRVPARRSPLYPPAMAPVASSDISEPPIVAPPPSQVRSSASRSSSRSRSRSRSRYSRSGTRSSSSAIAQKVAMQQAALLAQEQQNSKVFSDTTKGILIGAAATAGIMHLHSNGHLDGIF